jgi:hypothetical protein
MNTSNLIKLSVHFKMLQYLRPSNFLPASTSVGLPPMHKRAPDGKG